MKQSLPEIPMTDAALQQFVEQISLRYFHQPFCHKAFFNRRLKTTGGRYHLATHHLDFNPQVLIRYGVSELEKVIKHELCHYHLHLSGKGYQHKDREFKELLKKTGGTRYVQPLSEPKATKQHHYQCQACQALIVRQRRVNVQRYVCGKCGGALQLLPHKSN